MSSARAGCERVGHPPLLATVAGTTTTYHHADRLSVRLTTDTSGNKIGEQAHYPFGESWYASSTTTKWQFTSYERDSESGNDYAMARFHVNRLGRFSSPDLIAGTPADPQPLNRYAYSRNDPINFADPLGLRMDTTGCGLGGWMCGGGEGGGGVLWIDIGAPIFLQYLNDGLYSLYAVPISVQFFSFPRQLAGGGSGGIDAFKRAAEDLTKKKLNKKNCLKDLGAVGVTGDQVNQAAAAVNFLNGIGSTVPLSSLYQSSPVPSVRQAGKSATGTVGDYFKSTSGAVALSQLGGHDIYVNPGLINPSAYYQNLGVVFHELLHNVTGLTDADIQRALGLPESDITNNITQKLIKDCF